MKVKPIYSLKRQTSFDGKDSVARVTNHPFHCIRIHTLQLITLGGRKL